MLSLLTPPGSGDYSSYCSLWSVAGIFTTFAFPEGKHQRVFLTFKPYESLEQRCQHFVSNISEPPQLSSVAFLKLSQASKQTFWCSVFTHAQGRKNKKSPAYPLQTGTQADGTCCG